MKKGFYSILLLLFCFSLFGLPYQVSAQTIREFEAEVNRYTKELQEKKNKLAKNQAEVEEIKQKIMETNNQIQEAEDKIASLEKEIEESNKEIKEKDKESKKIIEYYQVANGENAYLEYAFGANDITDMVYRMSVVEQLMEYNDKIMKELEALIQRNEAMKKELTEKNKELEELKNTLQEQKARIDADSQEIIESMPSIEDRIKEAQSNLNYFKKLKCGFDEDILDCQYRVEQSTGSSLPSVGTFSRPIDYGYTVRGFTGWGHSGHDVSSGNRNIAVHPIANGQVVAVDEDNCLGGGWCNRATQGFNVWCNGNAKYVVVRHNYGGRYIYSTYMHLSGYGNVRAGQYVTKDTIIGYMGTTGCSTGEHLHLETAYCTWLATGGCTYNQYMNNLINPASLVSFPGSWNNR